MVNQPRHDRLSTTVAIIGAGAAGLMAAIWAARGGARVVLLEGTGKPGQKILISGGGRCNVLPGQALVSDFHTSGSPNTLRKILAAWPLPDVRRFFEQDLAVPLALEEESGKLFPASNRARTVLDALLAAAQAAGVDLRLQSRVSGLERRGGAGWLVRLGSGESSQPPGGAGVGRLVRSGYGQRWRGPRIARELGHASFRPIPR